MLSLHKIPTIQPRPIRRMHNNRAIPDKRRISRISREEKIRILDLKGVIRGDVDRAMLPTQIADLAGLRVSFVAGGFGAAIVGIEMATCFLAVCFFGGDLVYVDVVCCCCHSQSTSQIHRQTAYGKVHYQGNSRNQRAV